ncbi:hypothetical protein B0T21DRAFT_75227 [Apiosordaria backusii]|uniref:Uncharacterized protein n=1 Tax=Apiosordaria backusii TaxID=314023 RepID=A0AA40AAF0_9PEZI|nr:hypothetical protein B0T21DRAFT_75227 [Apiosordaria backusii]
MTLYQRVFHARWKVVITSGEFEMIIARPSTNLKQWKFIIPTFSLLAFCSQALGTITETLYKTSRLYLPYSLKLSKITVIFVICWCLLPVPIRPRPLRT